MRAQATYAGEHCLRICLPERRQWRSILSGIRMLFVGASDIYFCNLEEMIGRHFCSLDSSVMSLSLLTLLRCGYLSFITLLRCGWLREQPWTRLARSHWIASTLARSKGYVGMHAVTWNMGPL